MQKTCSLALVAMSFLVMPLHAQSIGEKTGVNAMLGNAPKADDFVKMVTVSDMFEVASSKLAQTNAADPKVKSFASKMVTDHTQTSSELKGMVTSGKVKVELPGALDSSHQSKLDKLKGLKGADFDKQYRSDQEATHKDAVSLFDRYSKGGDNADLKGFAGKTLPHLQEHLKMAQDLNKS